MTFPRPTTSTLLPLGAALALAAVAQVRDPAPAAIADASPPIYRCGDSYGTRPCGGAPPLPIARDPDAADRAQAADVARRERRLAADLAAQRQAREAIAPVAVAPRARPPRDCGPPEARPSPGMASRPSPAQAGTASAACPSTHRRRPRAPAAAASDTWTFRLPKKS